VPVAPAVAMANRYPTPELSFPGGVTGIPDVVYSQLNGYRPLRMDMYMPPEDGASHPMVMYIHGGGWQGGHSLQSGAFEDWPGTLAMIASRGYVVTSINYRLGGEAPPPAGIHDVKTALRWLRAHADEYGIDKEKFLVWGASAGGQLAGLAGTSCNVEALVPPNLPDELAAESDCVQATIGWYGIYDLTIMGEGGGPSGYFAGRLVEASPATYVDETDGAFLLIHGSTDPVIDYQQSVDFNNLLAANNVPSNLHIIPDVAHSYIGETPEATQAASILALEMSLSFMDETLK
jgi:acetyl esterase/lipase